MDEREERVSRLLGNTPQQVFEDMYLQSIVEREGVWPEQVDQHLRRLGWPNTTANYGRRAAELRKKYPEVYKEAYYGYGRFAECAGVIGEAIEPQPIPSSSFPSLLFQSVFCLGGHSYTRSIWPLLLSTFIIPQDKNVNTLDGIGNLRPCGGPIPRYDRPPSDKDSEWFEDLNPSYSKDAGTENHTSIQGFLSGEGLAFGIDHSGPWTNFHLVHTTDERYHSIAGYTLWTDWPTVHGSKFPELWRVIRVTKPLYNETAACGWESITVRMRIDVGPEHHIVTNPVPLGTVDYTRNEIVSQEKANEQESGEDVGCELRFSVRYSIEPSLDLKQLQDNAALCEVLPQHQVLPWAKPSPCLPHFASVAAANFSKRMTASTKQAMALIQNQNTISLNQVLPNSLMDSSPPSLVQLFLQP